MSEAKQEVKRMETQEITDQTSANVFAVMRLTNGQMVSMQYSMRHGLSADDILNDFGEKYKALDKIALNYGEDVLFWDGKTFNGYVSPFTPSQPSGAPAASQSQPPSNGNGNGNGEHKRDERKPLTQAEVPAELVEINSDIYAVEFDYFIIKPDLDGKSVVEFWQDNPKLKYPVGAIMNKWKHDTIREYLSKLTEQQVDPAKAEKYRIAGVQYFTLGKEYQGRNGHARYKDIQLLKPIF